jgi:hypothetical protein
MHIMEGRKGESSRELVVYDLEQRRLIDAEITRRTVDFMKRSVGSGKPFYAYVPFTQVLGRVKTPPEKGGFGGTIVVEPRPGAIRPDERRERGAPSGTALSPRMVVRAARPQVLIAAISDRLPTRLMTRVRL